MLTHYTHMIENKNVVVLKNKIHAFKILELEGVLILKIYTVILYKVE